MKPKTKELAMLRIALRVYLKERMENDQGKADADPNGIATIEDWIELEQRVVDLHKKRLIDLNT